MPTLVTPKQSSMQHVVEYGIGSRSLQENLTYATKQYQTSGVQANVHKLTNAVFEKYGDDAGILCPLLQITSNRKGHVNWDVKWLAETAPSEGIYSQGGLPNRISYKHHGFFYIRQGCTGIIPT
ncbi:hypothetical protein EDC04DRAFT_3087650 [Pisolithus marmoratus]|nr:hypothetical protein EDC04DRAFT_3087650 [Pisolithus marmoratus]